MSRREGRVEEFGSTGTFPVPNDSAITVKFVDSSVTFPKLATPNKVTSAGTVGSSITGTYADVGPSVSITTTGYPVSFKLVPYLGAGSGESNISHNRATNASGVQIQIYRDAVLINEFGFYKQITGSTNTSAQIWNNLYTEDRPAAGLHVYKIQARLAYSGSSPSGSIGYYRLVVEEIRT